MAEKKPYTLGFKLSEGYFRFFTLRDRHVLSTCTVTWGDEDKPLCDCTNKKLTGSCKHEKAFDTPSTRVYTAPTICKETTKDCIPTWVKAPALTTLLIVMDTGHVGLVHDGYKCCDGAYAFSDTFDAGLTSELHGESTNNLATIYSQFVKSHESKEGFLSQTVLEIKHVDRETLLKGLSREKDRVVEGSSRWRAIEMPDPTEFYVEPSVWFQGVYAILNGKNLLLTGPSGCGKTELVQRLATQCTKELASFNCGAMSEPRTTLIGVTHYSPEKGTYFKMARFAESVQGDNTVILLDELTRAGRDAFNILLPLLDRQKYLSLDESEEAPIIKRNEACAFFATANIGMEYTGTDALDVALKNRFACIIDVDFPPESKEIEVLCNRTGVPKDVAKKLVNIASVQRRMAKDDSSFIEFISTRMLLEAAEQAAKGMPLETAISFCICNHFSNEGGDESERGTLLKVVQKSG